MLQRIPVTPDWPETRAQIIRETTYTSYSRILIQTRGRFWKADGYSGNMAFNHEALHGVCETASDVPGERALLFGSAAAATTPDQTESAFREYYPGSTPPQIEQTLVFDWSQDPWAASCERLPFPLGKLAQFWPHILEPVGRIHFAGAYADNLNWGMEAATRSANRVVRTIDEA